MASESPLDCIFTVTICRNSTDTKQWWNRFWKVYGKLKFQFHSEFLLSVLFSIADMSKPNENYALSLSINEWHKNEMEWQYSNQAFHVMDGAWNLPIGRLYTQTARLAHFAFSNSWCTSAMEFNAIWWDFLHVPLCTTHIQHELNKSNQLLVRRVPFSIFAVVSCWNGECDSDTFTLCALLSVELSQAECRLYANLAYAVHRKPIYMQPILHGNDYGCNQAFLSRKKRTFPYGDDKIFDRHNLWDVRWAKEFSPINNSVWTSKKYGR